MLNPQPLPPCGLAALHTRFDAVMLNPQPLPPGGLSAIFTRLPGTSSTLVSTFTPYLPRE